MNLTIIRKACPQDWTGLKRAVLTVETGYVTVFVFSIKRFLAAVLSQPTANQLSNFQGVAVLNNTMSSSFTQFYICN